MILRPLTQNFGKFGRAGKKWLTYSYSAEKRLSEWYTFLLGILKSFKTAGQCNQELIPAFTISVYYENYTPLVEKKKLYYPVTLTCVDCDWLTCQPITWHCRRWRFGYESITVCHLEQIVYSITLLGIVPMHQERYDFGYHMFKLRRQHTKKVSRYWLCASTSFF